MRAWSILYQIVVGMSLLTLPWSRFWQENWFVWHTTGSLRFILLSGAARGAVSGLGAGILLQALGWSFADVLPRALSVRVDTSRAPESLAGHAGASVSPSIEGVQDPESAHEGARAARRAGTVDPAAPVDNPVNDRDQGRLAGPGQPPNA